PARLAKIVEDTAFGAIQVIEWEYEYDVPIHVYNKPYKESWLPVQSVHYETRKRMLAYWTEGYRLQRRWDTIWKKEPEYYYLTADKKPLNPKLTVALFVAKPKK